MSEKIYGVADKAWQCKQPQKALAFLAERSLSWNRKMPESALRPCNRQPCPNKVVSGSCSNHKPSRDRVAGSAHSRGYDRRWNKLRNEFLAALCDCAEHPSANCPRCLGTGLANAWCEEHKAKGILVRATQVDHVIPWLDRPELKMDVRDLQGLCDSDHSIKTSAEQHGTALSEFQRKQRAKVMGELSE